MLKIIIGAAMGVALAPVAFAQAGGSTYPAGSNLPQRTAGEVAPKPDAQLGGASGSTTRKVQGKAASRAGARPHKKGQPVPQPGASDTAH